MVEEAVGARAAGVDALLGLLHEGAVAAVHVVRQLAGLVVGFAAGRFDRRSLALVTNQSKDFNGCKICNSNRLTVQEIQPDFQHRWPL